MSRTGSLLERVRTLIAQRHGHDADHRRVLHSYVAAYVTMLQQTVAGVEAHALTLRRSRDEAYMALIHLESEADSRRDRPGERYVLAARAYLDALEAFTAGEGVGTEQLEQLRLDYEEIKEFVK